ncbi:NAD(P)/FAD-dependent oxidoreductase [Auraticoccus monumenti]|uniref:Thioredoxin reductase n=1 Tax=Auraticoccus monumenti TaxID=675864 RepID=A0A1G6TQP4_9ACTN|nr:NAD(P)/FAD-dependent oxidoreductase [Auraticoccus monumenti]SDD31214.1 Thioredoxin reductase [Auraticoccus monumenti]
MGTEKTSAENTTGTDAAERDVVVVGGGAAGLSAAVALGRSRRSVTVVDAGAPRNAPAEGVHTYLGHEGVSPLELLRIGRAEAEGYGVEVVDGQVTRARPLGEPDGEPSFEVELADGRRFRARRVVVATGLGDVLPDVPGVAEQWGRGVVHCPYCHGWEVRDQRIGVLATSPIAGHQARLFRQLSEHVTVLTHLSGDLPEQDVAELDALGVRFVDGEVTALESDGDRVVGARLADGTLVELDALAVATTMHARVSGLEELGLPVDEFRMGDHLFGTNVTADPTGRTSVPGVWVAGNVAVLHAQVVASAAAGMMAGAQVNGDLALADGRAALAARAGLREALTTA